MNGPMQPGKVKTGSTIRTETKTVSENGVTETIVTRIITDHYTDGSTGTRQETQSSRQEEVLNGGPGQGPGQIQAPVQGQVGQRFTNVQNSQQYQPQQQQQQQQQQSLPQQQRMSQPSQHPMPFVPPPQQLMKDYDDEISLSVYGHGPRQGQSGQRTPDEIFVDEAQRCHNKYRAKHNVPPVTVSRDLCKAAQTWADTLAQRGNMENSHFGYGENIYWSSGPGHAMKGDVPVEYWYHEEAHFDWGRMDFQKTTGSFTQLIWKDSKQFGIAKSTGSRGTFVVAFYIPPGNVLSKFHENVFQASQR